MPPIDLHVKLVFIACVIASFGFLYYSVKFSVRKSNLPTIVLFGLLFWIALIGGLTYSDFFSDFNSRPPRLMLFAMMAMTFIIALFVVPRSRAFINRIPIATITHIHIIRIPVEIVLWWLFLAGAVPETITFEGTNYDIVSGITAPFVALFLVGKKNQSRIGAILWNFAALGLLLNVVFRAVAATPYFNDGLSSTLNVAMFYYPFIYLPLFVVPAVFFAHLASLYQLIFIPQERY
jgi:hypothetical protein